MSTEDRRAPGAARISFEGLVEVGGTLGPSFEAQAVNVSEEGMQLRTAYLPDLGQQVTCRFEAAPNESVIGSGEVVWCRGAERGGEFGIRFTDIDADSVEALKHVCGMGPGDAAEAQPGAKVRLYIEGLASPMRAKIRDSRQTAITVGSDLGFLQVGKQLELEDAQTGAKRPASIDHVEVAVDPASHIPQLVVTLRYSDLAADGQIGEAGAKEKIDAERSDDTTASHGPSIPMRGAFATQAARLGPTVRRLVNRARLTIALLAKRRRSEDDSVPRRTTAPAPSGGLHATGRRVVRGDATSPTDAKLSTSRRSQHPDDAERIEAAPKAIGRRAAAAGAVMLIAVLGAVAIKKSHREAAPVVTAAPVPAETPSGTGSAAAAVPAPAATTTQQAPTDVAPAIAPAPSPGSPTETPSSAGTTNTADERADGSHPAAHKKRARVTPFGNGPVRHGNVLRLRMDGPIESIEGAQQPTGFEVKVPGHRSLEAAAPLAVRDSRIATIKVNNESTGAMLTVAFKDGVPNYQVSAKGDTLVIALAPMGPLEATVAKRDDRSAKSPKHGTRTHDETPER